MTTAEHARIAALPIWRAPPAIAPLQGGITNRNFLADDGHTRAVIRLGGDIPAHGILRFNELAASRAAACCGISPPVLHAEPGLLAIGFIAGRTLDGDGLRARAQDAGRLLRRMHEEMKAHLRGPLLAFNVFHVLRDYAHTLRAAGSPFMPLLPELLRDAARIEAALAPEATVFAHNDCLAANFIDDGSRLWLIDWDYAGVNLPSFDLANLCANNGFSPDQEAALLHAYHDGRVPGQAAANLRLLRAASALREAMWSMVQAIAPAIAFDYVAYAQDNLRVFAAERTRCENLP